MQDCIQVGENLVCSRRSLYASFTSSYAGGKTRDEDVVLTWLLRKYPQIRCVSGLAGIPGDKHPTRQDCYFGVSVVRSGIGEIVDIVHGYFDDNGELIRIR